MDKSSSATCDVFYTCDGVKGEPSPTWLRKNRGEDEEETGRNGQSRSWRFSFHKYFTTFFSLFRFIDYFYFIIFFYTFFTHNLHPRPTTSTHYPRPTTFSYNHCKYITLHYTINFKVFRYSFSEAIPIFFNRLKCFFPRPIAIKFSPVIGYGLKFVKM